MGEKRSLVYVDVEHLCAELQTRRESSRRS